MHVSNAIASIRSALAEVNYIPSTYNIPVDPNSDVGLIVDYQSYAAVYDREKRRLMVTIQEGVQEGY